MKKHRCVAIVLAAGAGKRMNSDVQKQYLMLGGKPVIYYSLHAFEREEWIDEIVLVAGKGEIEYCREHIIEHYCFKKVNAVVEGGAERYDSVHEGLKVIESCDYVFIHDGARPFIDGPLLRRVYEGAQSSRACVPGMPAKDTVKLIDEDGFVKETPDRKAMFIMQTPQTFAFELVREAYCRFMERKDYSITDDAMVVERYTGVRVKVVQGSYQNIKITTPEDMEIGNMFLARAEKERDEWQQ